MAEATGAPGAAGPPRGSARWLRRGASLAAGAALAFAFAPAQLWLLALLAPAVLLALWSAADSPREGAWLGFAFSLGTYAIGTWWLYIAIRVFGQAPLWVAGLVMGSLVVIMAAWQAGLGWFVLRCLPRRSPATWLVGAPAAWLLVEWWRGWFLSGFPWLSLGYSQTGTWLAALAPVGGTYLVSAALLCGAGALVTLWRGDRGWRLVAVVVLVLPWTVAGGLRGVQWTRADGRPVTVALLQGAVPQDMKWLASNAQAILDGYASLHREALGADIIVWPESALPDLVNTMPRYVGRAWSAAREAGSAVLMGVMRYEPQDDTYYNSLLALDQGEPAFYDKQHLVPFGEYFPVPRFVRNWLRLMNLPYSDFTRGAPAQPPLAAGGTRLAASICYEDAYMGELLPAVRSAGLLVNVTNDAWFGRSGARYQHLQIARMRAIESERFLLRAANDGVSAVIDPRGSLVAVAPEYAPAVLRATVQPRAGMTPYVRIGNLPVLVAAGLALAALLVARGRRRRPAATPPGGAAGTTP